MDTLIDLFERRPQVTLHLMAALVALALGAWLLMRRKGTAGHRVVGWIWVAAMATAVASSAFIRDGGLPNLAGFSPIHLLTLFVALQLPRAVAHARAGRIQAHRKAMRALYLGGCVVAGAFALLPMRFLGQQLAGVLA